MLRSITAKQFRDWEFYAALEPFDETRQDLRAASLETLLANLNRDPKKPAYKIEDFLLRFGEREKQSNTRDIQIAIIKAVASLYSSNKVKDEEDT